MGRCSVNMSALPHFLVSKLMKPTLPSLPGISSLQGDLPRPSAPPGLSSAQWTERSSGSLLSLLLLQHPAQFCLPQTLSTVLAPLRKPPSLAPAWLPANSTELSWPGLQLLSSLLSHTVCGGTSLFRSFPKHPLYILPVIYWVWDYTDSLVRSPLSVPKAGHQVNKTQTHYQFAWFLLDSLNLSKLIQSQA